MATATTKITASCACKSFTLDVYFPTASLPLARALCLCSSCRRFSGSCGVSYIALPSSQTIETDNYSLTSYNTSAGFTRYFCSTCGAHTLARRAADGIWRIATGLWNRTEGLIKWTGCKFVEGTIDGGISVWLNDIVDQDGKKRKLQRWKLQDIDQEPVQDDVFQEYVRLGSHNGFGDRLKASCHCGGVKFYLTRPNEASKRVRSPFADLIVPYHTGASSRNSENLAWWIRQNDTKYLAGTCACTSCRLASGFEVQPWSFVPKCNIFQEDGTGLEYTMGTLKKYLSSENIWREFCSVCGATVFWHCEERPDLVDVSVGLFDPLEGARVEDWLDWYALYFVKLRMLHSQ